MSDIQKERWHNFRNVSVLETGDVNIHLHLSTSPHFGKSIWRFSCPQLGVSNYPLGSKWRTDAQKEALKEFEIRLERLNSAWKKIQDSRKNNITNGNDSE